MENPNKPESDQDSELRPRNRLKDTIARVLAAPAPSEIEVLRREQASKDRDRPDFLRELERQAGERYRHCRFSNWKAETPYQMRVLSEVRSWADTWPVRREDAEGLVLYGPVGSGKDHLAFAAVRQVAIENRVGVHWINGRAFAGDIRDRIEEGNSERELISRLASPVILVVSDPLPPVGDLTQHQADMLYRVIDARYTAGRMTVCTLNVNDDDEADRRLGAATWDRLCDRAWKIATPIASRRKPSREVKP